VPEKDLGATLIPPVSESRDHIRGDSGALVTLTEYGDYECPHCAAAQPVVESIIEFFGPNLRMAFRHFPLSQMHPHAARAAEAAEIAGAQERFWEMHDILFQNQTALEDEDLGEYAAAIGLDLKSFVRELASGVRMARVRDDFTSGIRSGVNGTPTFFINGVRHDGLPDFASLQAAIAASLADDGKRARPSKAPPLKAKRREA
jgi:protein-disulfide isomerase